MTRQTVRRRIPILDGNKNRPFSHYLQMIRELFMKPPLLSSNDKKSVELTLQTEMVDSTVIDDVTNPISPTEDVDENQPLFEHHSSETSRMMRTLSDHRQAILTIQELLSDIGDYPNRTSEIKGFLNNYCTIALDSAYEIETYLLVTLDELDNEIDLRYNLSQQLDEEVSAHRVENVAYNEALLSARDAYEISHNKSMEAIKELQLINENNDMIYLSEIVSATKTINSQADAQKITLANCFELREKLNVLNQKYNDHVIAHASEVQKMNDELAKFKNYQTDMHKYLHYMKGLLTEAETNAARLGQEKEDAVRQLRELCEASSEYNNQSIEYWQNIVEGHKTRHQILKKKYEALKSKDSISTMIANELQFNENLSVLEIKFQGKVHKFVRQYSFEEDENNY